MNLFDGVLPPGVHVEREGGQLGAQGVLVEAAGFDLAVQQGGEAACLRGEAADVVAPQEAQVEVARAHEGVGRVGRRAEGEGDVAHGDALHGGHEADVAEAAVDVEGREVAPGRQVEPDGSADVGAVFPAGELAQADEGHVGPERGREAVGREACVERPVALYKAVLRREGRMGHAPGHVGFEGQAVEGIAGVAERVDGGVGAQRRAEGQRVEAPARGGEAAAEIGRRRAAGRAPWR